MVPAPYRLQFQSNPIQYPIPPNRYPKPFTSSYRRSNLQLRKGIYIEADSSSWPTHSHHHPIICYEQLHHYHHAIHDHHGPNRPPPPIQCQPPNFTYSFTRSSNVCSFWTFILLLLLILHRFPPSMTMSHLSMTMFPPSMTILLMQPSPSMLYLLHHSPRATRKQPVFPSLKCTFYQIKTNSR